MNRSFVLLINPQPSSDTQIRKAAGIFKFKDYKVEDMPSSCGMRVVRITDGVSVVGNMRSHSKRGNKAKVSAGVSHKT